LAKWEGDYFPEQDEQLSKASVKQFGRNLAKDKDKKRRGR
ncbi:MAG: outer membrane protein assembly factor BamE, partial [Lysobacter sp.]